MYEEENNENAKNTERFPESSKKQNVKKVKETQKSLSVFGSLKGLCFAGILTAMSIILGKFLQIPNPFQEIIRISFENLPIMLSAFCLGPIAAAAVGAVADLIGCLLYGYSINPIITLGAASVGLVSGFISEYIVKKPLVLKIITCEAAAHTVGSVLIKSAGLAAWYLAKYNIGYWELAAWRLLTYTLVGIAESVILILLLKNKEFQKQIERMRGKK